MSYYSQVIKKVKELGGSIDKSEDFLPDKRCIIIEAPEGKQWAAHGDTFFVVNWYPSYGETKEEAFKDVLERIDYGLEPREIFD